MALAGGAHDAGEHLLGVGTVAGAVAIRDGWPVRRASWWRRSTGPTAGAGQSARRRPAVAVRQSADRAGPILKRRRDRLRRVPVDHPCAVARSESPLSRTSFVVRPERPVRFRGDATIASRSFHIVLTRRSQRLSTRVRGSRPTNTRRGRRDNGSMPATRTNGGGTGCAGSRLISSFSSLPGLK